MEISVKQAQGSGEGNSDELTTIRKQISSLGIYCRLYSDFNKLAIELQSCQELMQDSDKDVRKMAEDDLKSLKEQLEELQVEIEDEAVPKREIDSRNVTLEIK